MLYASELLGSHKNQGLYSNLQLFPGSQLIKGKCVPFRQEVYMPLAEETGTMGGISRLLEIVQTKTIK